MGDGILDEAYERLHTTGPELVGGLTNHGPMVVECLVHLGRADSVHRWLDGYAGELDELPVGRPLVDWRPALGDAGRLADWLATLARDDRPWQDLLALWWPRLAPGMAAAATHGVIRTGHAVRALRDGETAPRRAELAQALAYWAALWRPVPALVPSGERSVRDALPAVPALARQQGGAYERLSRLAELPGWAESVTALRPVREPSQVLSDVVDAALRTYAGRADGEPVMLVHAVTAPAAVALVLPSLPRPLHRVAVETAWTTSAALVSAYAAADAVPAGRPVADLDDTGGAGAAAHDAVDRAVAHGDAHVVKLVEAAVRAADSRAGLQAAAAAVALIS